MSEERVKYSVADYPARTFNGEIRVPAGQADDTVKIAIAKRHGVGIAAVSLLERDPITVRFDELAIDQWFRTVAPMVGYYEGAYIKKAAGDSFPNAMRVNDRVAVFLPGDIPVKPMVLDTISFSEAAQ